MKVALINGSPKKKYSASSVLLRDLSSCLPGSVELVNCHFRLPQISQEDWEQLSGVEVLVFAFPLYVDGLPSHFLSCLEQLDQYYNQERPEQDILVYALVNCGFYEGEQTKLALEILKNWCGKANLTWGQGIGIGSGGLITALENIPQGKGLKKNIDKALQNLAKLITGRQSASDVYVTHNLPRFVYKKMVELYWRQLARNNGLTPKDLSRKL